MPRIPQIRIEQQKAEIAVKSTPASMRISKPQLKMKITSEIPKFEAHQQVPRFKMNWKKVRSESGIKSQGEMSKAYREAGRQAALQGAKQAASDGNFLGNMRIHGDRVAMLAKNKALSDIQEKRQINVGLMPKSSPQVEWDKGSMRVSWSTHSLVIDWEGDYMPQVTVDPPHSVEVYLRTKPYVKVMVEDTAPPSNSMHVDAAI